MNATTEAIKYLTELGYKVEKDPLYKNLLQITQELNDNCHYHLFLRNKLSAAQAYKMVEAIENVLKLKEEDNDYYTVGKFLNAIEDILQDKSLTIMGKYNAIQDFKKYFK